MSGCCSTQISPGETASPSSGDAVAAKEWLKLGIAALIAGQTMVFGLGVNISPPEGTERWVIHALLAVSVLAVYLLAGLPLTWEAFKQLRRGRVVLEQLFLAGIAGAFFASLHATLTGHGDVYYEVVAVLLAIYTFGNLIRRRRRQAALRSAEVLRREFETCRRLTCCGKVVEVPLAEVEPGDRLVVYPGDGVPVDGVVAEGVGFVRETPLTGEPFPVVRREGDEIFAGTTVLDDRIVIEARTAGNARRLDGLLRRVAEAHERPSHIQEEADRLVSWFLPIVLVVSLLTLVFWTWSAGWVVGLFNSLAVLVVACPCAMGLATPIGIWNALNALASRGVVAGSGDFIDRMGRVDTVVFDKTGTLSEENLQLVDFADNGKYSRDTIKSWVGALQAHSRHPVARAFHEWRSGEAAVGVSDYKTLPGVGVEGWVKSGEAPARRVRIGNERLLDERASSEAEALRRKLKASERQSRELFVEIDGVLAGVGVLRETLRASVDKLFFELERMGIEVHVMTGDREASLSGLDWKNARAGLLPEEKADLVRGLREAGKTVLYVGDGVNDSPALAAADAGLALASGAGLAREAARAELFGADLAAVPEAIGLCGRVLRGIRNNLLYAGVYNVAGISLASSGVLHPVVAALLMVVSSFTVTVRALRFSEHRGKAGDSIAWTAAEGEEPENPEVEASDRVLRPEPYLRG